MFSPCTYIYMYLNTCVKTSQGIDDCTCSLPSRPSRGVKANRRSEENLPSSSRPAARPAVVSAKKPSAPSGPTRGGGGGGGGKVIDSRGRVSWAAGQRRGVSPSVGGAGRRTPGGGAGKKVGCGLCECISICMYMYMYA